MMCVMGHAVITAHSTQNLEITGASNLYVDQMVVKGAAGNHITCKS
jgi:hypothetical protein